MKMAWHYTSHSEQDSPLYTACAFRTSSNPSTTQFFTTKTVVLKNYGANCSRLTDTTLELAILSFYIIII